MGTIKSHRDLLVWQKALEFGLQVYQMTSSFPDSERFGLVSQLRRASVSVASNIAEGYGRGSTSDYVRFLRTARGSLNEIDTQLLFANRLGFLSQTAYDHAISLLNEISRMLIALIRSLETRSRT